jgi:HEAT repeats/PQQ-like domain
LRQAVRDPHAGKRAAAAIALIRAGGLKSEDDRQALVKDPSVNVRLQATLALVEAREKDAVPHLIERLADAPPEQLWRVSDLLERIAGDKAPAVYPCAKTPPAQVRDAWQKWWTANAATVDLAKLSDAPPYLGYTLISMMGAPKANGGARVVELRPDREPHWEIDNLTYPLDARVIGADKVLIAEYLGRRVTERTFKGEILWEMPVNMPIACQRLPGGETFIAARNQLLVVDADKKTIFSYLPPNGSISAAFRLRDGQTALVASTGQCHWLDPQGKELKSFHVGYVYPMGGNLEVLPNRHVLVPLYRDGKVAEFDADGKIVSQLQVQSPVSATRLPNGNTLVSTMTQQVLEMDRDGQTVWTYRTDGRALRARGR